MNDSRKKKRGEERLTPVYVVQVESNVPCGIYHQYRRDELGDACPVSVSEKDARVIVADCEKRGIGARAYHYGWEQRGFRSGEETCKELCRNNKWVRWY